jgi:DNA modification methylase
LKLTQQTLCDRAAVSKPTTIKLERNQGHVSSLVTIMEALGLEIALVPNERSGVEAQHPDVRIHVGDCRDILPLLPERQFHMCVTSPPYFRQRDYAAAGQTGLEDSDEEYIASVVGIMREVRRVLRDDGALWLVIGDAFARRGSGTHRRRKEILGLPWRVAFELQKDGWFLRQEIILNKANPLPEPVKDRFVRSHEYLFHLTKRQQYWFDADAVRERGVTTNAGSPQRDTRDTHGAISGGNTGLNAAKERLGREIEETGFSTRYKRTVWSYSTQSGRHGHFAAFPEALVETCIRAGCPEGGMVLDPFGGSGTTGLVAQRLNRGAHLIELNPEYAKIAQKRCSVPLVSTTIR